MIPGHLLVKVRMVKHGARRPTQLCYLNHNHGARYTGPITGSLAFVGIEGGRCGAMARLSPITNVLIVIPTSRLMLLIMIEVSTK